MITKERLEFMYETWRITTNSCIKQEGLNKAPEIGALGIYEKVQKSCEVYLNTFPEPRRTKCLEEHEEMKQYKDESIAAIQAVLTFRKHYAES